MVEKYIIEKCDIHDLLTGQDIPLSQGRARAFCVEITGEITNGDVIKSIFPHYDIEIDEHKGYVRIFYEDFYTIYPMRWWNAPFKEVEE